MERRVQYYSRDLTDITLPDEFDVEIERRELDAGGVLLFSPTLVDSDRADELERRIHELVSGTTEE